MKFVRGLYLAACYIVGLPLAVLFLTPFVLWQCIYSKKTFGEWGVKETVDSLMRGFKIGHSINMNFVEYGRNWNYLKLKD